MERSIPSDLSPPEIRRGKTLWLFTAIGALSIVASLVIAAAVAGSFYSIRTAAKWSLWSQRYKGEVLAQSETARELKHIEWDGWGWAGQDTNVYLVFDSTDSLSVAAANHAPGKFNGLPCEVAQVRQLESRIPCSFIRTSSGGGAMRLIAQGLDDNC